MWWSFLVFGNSGSPGLSSLQKPGVPSLHLWSKMGSQEAHLLTIFGHLYHDPAAEVARHSLQLSSKPLVYGFGDVIGIVTLYQSKVHTAVPPSLIVFGHLWGQNRHLCKDHLWGFGAPSLGSHLWCLAKITTCMLLFQWYALFLHPRFTNPYEYPLRNNIAV